ncbi:MAG: prolyl oligopeptidase family serine peptidase [Phenylobacterium sp.]|uniref:dienelactone hydrolase family protein n=1 Tax=Phenylobacterium sp. TaxID=1871053 RepID=UPI0025F7A01C|nr:dienelactone hydrolase family protein [Phenylobacterium sp.]MBI1198026.1 prolyl oligopeptidase family serine peptidase [Phenylobacterium sp.]
MDFRTCYVAFETRAETPLTVAGRLDVPLTEPGQDPARTPAVLICHGSDGVDGRGQFHAQALRAAGWSTLELDMWAARGTVRGAVGRPKTVPETLPDAFAALSFLAKQPEVDPRRIAIMGFSWGGVVSVLSATRRYAEVLAEPGLGFVAHAAFYPVLWSYNRAPGHEFADLTGAPVLIQAGGADAYDTPEVCDAFLGGLDPATRGRVTLVVHEGATHAFDRDLPAKTIEDPYAHNGKGGPVRFEFDPKAAGAARDNVVRFFGEAFAKVPA